MIGADGRQGGAAPLCAPEAAKRRRSASYPFLKPLNGASDLPTTFEKWRGPAIPDLAVQVNVTAIDVHVLHSDGTVRDSIIAGIVDLHTGQVIGFRQGTNAPVSVRQALAEMIATRGLPTTVAMGEGCDAVIIIAVHEELRAHGGWLPDLLAVSSRREGRSDD